MARGIDPLRGLAAQSSNPLDPPAGCQFPPRCPRAMERGAREAPLLREVAPGRMTACHLND